MAEYIKKLTMRNCCIDEDGQTDEPIIKKLNEVIDFINSIDVSPVRHGRWGTHSDRPDSLICSVCNCGFDMWKHDPHNYCPNCGAKMEGVDDG